MKTVVSLPHLSLPFPPLLPQLQTDPGKSQAICADALQLVAAILSTGVRVVPQVTFAGTSLAVHWLFTGVRLRCCRCQRPTSPSVA